MHKIRKEFLYSISSALTALFMLYILIHPILSSSLEDRIAVAGLLSVAFLFSTLSFRFYFEGRKAFPEQSLLMACLYKTVPLCVTMLTGIFMGLYFV